MVFVKGEWLTLYKALVDQDDKENINYTVLFSKISMSLRSVNVGEREREKQLNNYMSYHSNIRGRQHDRLHDSHPFYGKILRPTVFTPRLR